MLQLVVYCLLIAVASLVGGWLPQVARLSHTGTQILMSFVAGLMLGVGVFHMIPHANLETSSLDRTVWWLMVGLLTMFFLQRLFHFHQHGPTEFEEADEHVGEEGHGHHHGSPPAATQGTANHVHGPDCHHHHPRKVSWLGVFVGLTIHTLLDGVALAASLEVEQAASGGAQGLFGLAAFLAIFLHKPLDAVAITSLMMAEHWPAGARKAVNALFALMVPLGAVLFYLGVKQVGGNQSLFVGCALAFSAGTFLCISLSDLLPEVQFHSHDRAKLSLALVLGIALAYAIGFFEHTGHEHLHRANDSHESLPHSDPPAQPQHDHSRFQSKLQKGLIAVRGWESYAARRARFRR